MTGSCHCGAVSVTLKQKPDFVNFCDCSFCSKMGGAWAYTNKAEANITGRTVTYSRADYEKPVVEMHSCAKCYATTHWTITEGTDPQVAALDSVGVNIRIFDPADCENIEARFLDGRNWFGKTPPKQRKPNSTITPAVFN